MCRDYTVSSVSSPSREPGTGRSTEIHLASLFVQKLKAIESKHTQNFFKEFTALIFPTIKKKTKCEP